jgi:hypothetical protein
LLEGVGLEFGEAIVVRTSLLCDRRVGNSK